MTVDQNVPTEPEDDEEPPTPGRRRPITKLVVGVVAGGVAVWLVISAAGGIGDALDAIRHMRVGFVALAVGIAAARLGLYGLQLAWLGRRSGRLGLATAFGLASVVYGFGAAMPAAPAEGLALASRELRRRGRTKRQSRLTVGLSEWFAQRAFYAVAAIDLIIAVAQGHLTWSDAWPLVVAAAMVIMTLGATAVLARRPTSAERVAVALGAIRLRRPHPAETEARRRAAGAWHAEAVAMLGPPRNRVRLAVVSALAVVADGATLWATCHAAGFHLHPELAILAATVGTMASWVPLLPSGLGLVEAAVPALMARFGVPLPDAFAATVVYRAAGTLLPVFAGALALAALRSHHR
jgi:putative heme transporter